jgi:hypothetical protein
LDRDDPPPDVSDESVRRGRELLDLMIQSMGGAEKIDSLKTYDDKMYRVAGQPDAWDARFIRFPDAFAEKHQRGEVWYSMSDTGDVAWFASNESAERMAKSQHRAYRRMISRNPLIIVRSRALPTFICSHIGEGEINGAAVEQVAVALNGATTILLIDPTSGKLNGMTFRGRGPNAFLGEVEFALSNHQTFDGVTIPVTRTATFNGEHAPAMSGTIDEVRINQPIDPAQFTAPD